MMGNSNNPLALRVSIFERLFDASPDATIIVDSDGTIAYASIQCQALLGYVPDQLIGQSIETLVPVHFREGHPAHRESFLRHSTPRPMGAGRALAALHKDGRTIPIEVSLSPIHTGGSPLVAAALRDVTDRIQAETQLREARDEAEKATRTKTRFLAAASHDLRQPLQSISAYASVLEAKVADEELTGLIRKIHSSISGMSEILDTLLDVSQLDAGSIVPNETDFELEQIFSRLRDAYGEVATRKGLNLRISGDAFSVHTDCALLERIVENLVTNAIKYTTKGHVTVSAHREGHLIRIDVSDSGAGIPADQHKAIFEEYIQLENPTRDAKKGLGIGLALVQRLTDLLHIDLTLKSSPGDGSIFSILIAEASNAAHQNDGAPSAAAEQHSNMEIIVLFVEDDDAIRDSMTLLLDLQGFQVHAASDGVAVDKLLGDGLQPDIIVSDFRLPERTGVDIITDTRSGLGRLVPAIIMTGDTAAKQIKSVGLDACNILHKPAEPGELADNIRQLVAEHG